MPARLLTPRKAVLVKKAIIIVVVIFVIYFLLTAPTDAANVVDLTFQWIIDAFQSIAAFIRALFF